MIEVRKKLLAIVMFFVGILAVNAYYLGMYVFTWLKGDFVFTDDGFILAKGDRVLLLMHHMDSFSYLVRCIIVWRGVYKITKIYIQEHKKNIKEILGGIYDNFKK